MASATQQGRGLVSVPLRGPLTLVLVLLVIGTTVATGWISYRAASRSVEDEAVVSLASAAAARDNNINVAMTHRRERVQSTLQSVELGCGITGVMVTSCTREMLRSFLRTERAYGASLYYGSRVPVRVGAFTGGTNSPTGLPLVQVGPKDRAYVTVAVSDPESGLTLAVDFSAAGLVQTTELLRVSTHVVSRIGGKEVVITDDGPRPVGGALAFPRLNQCMAGTEGWTVHQRQYISFRPSRAFADSCVMALRDEQEILAPVLRLKGKIARVGILFAAFALVLSYLLALWLAHPIVRLQQRVRALRRGDYITPVPIVGLGEVRELAHAFAAMKDSVVAHRASLVENERRLAVVYKAARLWTWEHDLASGRIISHDPEGENRPEKMSFHGLLQRVHREDREVVCAAVRKAQVTGIYDAEYRITLPDGSLVWMSSRGQLIEQPQRKMIGVSLDVTARKNAETLIRETDRLEASAEIAGALAHEINNPLTAILGAMYMLRQQPIPDPAAARYFQIAEQETQRVAQLANQILGLYNPPGTLTTVDVRSLLEDMIASCQAESTAKKQRVVLHENYCGVVTGFREELLHGLCNVLRNAIESSPQGSEINIRGRVTHSITEVEGWGIRISIADEGPGIPASELARVFEPFTGTKPQKGTGLGLWVARSTVIKHGGSIRIRVIRGKRQGTVVSVFLPARNRGKNVSRVKPSPDSTIAL